MNIKQQMTTKQGPQKLILAKDIKPQNNTKPQDQGRNMCPPAPAKLNNVHLYKNWNVNDCKWEAEDWLLVILPFFAFVQLS